MERFVIERGQRDEGIADIVKQNLEAHLRSTPRQSDLNVLLEQVKRPELLLK